jgi:hypothetical protein
LVTPNDPNQAAIQQFLTRAQQGDRSVLSEVHEVLDTHPEIWSDYGDLARRAKAAWLDLIAGEDLLLRESMSRHLEALEGELGHAEGSPLEKSLIERITACWLQTQHAEAAFIRMEGSNGTAPARLLKRQDQAQRRLLAADKQLALVRKLLKPAQSPAKLALKGVPQLQPHSQDRSGLRAEAQK